MLKGYIFRFILYITLLLACSAARAAECKISYKGKATGLKYNLSAEECQTIFYNGGQLVTMRVRYPDAHVVADEIKKENILFYFIYSNNKKTDLWGLFKDKSPTRFVGDIRVYGTPDDEDFVFMGEDGEGVFVTRMGRTWMAKRMFKGVYVKYQFNAEEYSDFKAMDKFALRFLQHVTLIQ